MSRCPYCRRELAGFETICQDCFEAGYQRIIRPTPWWRRIQLTHDVLHVFLCVFAYAYIVGQINRDRHPTTIGLALLALVLAAFMVVVEIALGDSGKPKVRHRLLYGFLCLVIYFFVRLWSVSSYHPIRRPALFALVFATIAAMVESVRTRPGRTPGPQKKGAGRDVRRPEDHSRDAV